MAERQRSILDRILRRQPDPSDAEKISDLINGRNMPNSDDLTWDGKTLASLAKIGTSTSVGRQKRSVVQIPKFHTNFSGRFHSNLRS